VGVGAGWPTLPLPFKTPGRNRVNGFGVAARSVWPRAIPGELPKIKRVNIPKIEADRIQFDFPDMVFPPIMPSKVEVFLIWPGYLEDS
jgi:hypothetical protein